jgi:hypothetical protein
LITVSKPFNPLFSESSVLSRYCTISYCLFWLQHLKVAPSIFAQMILDKLKRCMTIITFCIQFSRQKVMHHNIYHFGQCMVLHHHRQSVDWLTNVLPIQPRVVLGFLRSILLLLTLQGCYSSFVVVFNHMTMMPCRNLRPHVHCSHIIEPLGAHWWLGICDVTPLQPLLMQPY